jgi:hypothetical protein
MPNFPQRIVGLIRKENTHFSVRKDNEEMVKI